MTHEPYEIISGKTIFGGNAWDPLVPDCDIYVSHERLKRPMRCAFPWRAGEGFEFPITNLKAPDPRDYDEYRMLIAWLADQVERGKAVHVGCIGGHGRTGTTLAALRAYMAKDPDAIMHVRQNYCRRAVETEEQILFLVMEYGCNYVQPRPFKEDARPTPPRQDVPAGPLAAPTDNKVVSLFGDRSDGD